MGDCRMMADTPVLIGETEYLARYPISALIRAEAELGKPVRAISGAFSEMAIIARHGLWHMDKSPVSKKEFDAILDSLTVDEFTEVFNIVAGTISGGKNTEPGAVSAGEESGKN